MKRIVLASLLLAVTVAVTLAPRAKAQIDSWPMFHHDTRHTGFSTSTAPNTNDTIWTYSTDDDVKSSPAIVDGKVYVGSNDESVYCLDVSTGDVIWSYSTGGQVFSSPAVADGKVYVGSNDDTIYCLDAAGNGDGTTNLIWSHPTGSWVQSSPTIADGKVYVGSNDFNVYCLDADGNGDGTTNLIWSHPTDFWVPSSPAFANGKVYVGSYDDSIYCLDASNGNVFWKFGTGGNVFPSPAVAHGMVYVGASDGIVYCLPQDDPNGNGIIESDEVNWKFNTDEEVHSTPAIAYDKVYVGSFDSTVYCLPRDDPNEDGIIDSGEVIWSYTTGSIINSSPSVADGKVYVGSYDNKVYCLNASNGDSIWSYETQGDVVSTPAIFSNTIIVGSNDNKIYAFGQPVCQVSPINLGFGTVAIGDYLDKNFTITNIGAGTLSDTVSESCDQFDIISGGGPYNLTTGQSVTVTVRFEPASIGPKTCTINTGSDLCSNVYCSGLGERGEVNWPMFHHDPKRTGYSVSTAPNTGEVLWIYSIPGPILEDDSKSSPAVTDGKVYLGSNNGRIYCLDALDGDYIWSYETGKLVESSPAVADGKVYVGSNNGKIYCLDALDGDYIWSHETYEAVKSSPAVANGKVYVGSDDRRIYCLDTLGGDIWSYETDSQVRSSPAVYLLDPDYEMVCVGSDCGRIYCLNALSGDSIWSFQTNDSVRSSPAADEFRVYVGSDNGKIYCLDAWVGHFIWSYQTNGPVRSSPAVADGKVYVGSDDYWIYCLNATNGDYIWSYQTNGPVRSSPAVADGKIYMGSNDGVVCCLDATGNGDGTTNLIWIHTTEHPVKSSPAIAGGKVYVSIQDYFDFCRVIAFGLPDCYKEGDPAFYVDFDEDTLAVKAGETVCRTVGPTNFGFVSGTCPDTDTFCVWAHDNKGWPIIGDPPLGECYILDSGYIWWQDICITAPCDVGVCDYNTLIINMTYCDHDSACRYDCTDCEDPNLYGGYPRYSSDTVVLHVVESPPALYILQDSLWFVETGQPAAYIPFSICNGSPCADPMVFEYEITSTGHIGGGFPQSGSTSPVSGGECQIVYGVVDAGIAVECDYDTLKIIAWDHITGTIRDTCVQIIHVLEPCQVPLITAPVLTILVLSSLIAAAVIFKRKAAGRT